MLLVAENWEKTPYERYKDQIVSELFDTSVSVALKELKEDTEALRLSSDSTSFKWGSANMSSFIETWLKNFVSTLKVPFFWDDEDIRNCYICTYVFLPTGGILVSFIAKLHECPDPVRLEMIY